MTARISVLLPARNAAATLAVCLRSVVRQTERRWECVVVDDDSRDDTREVADAAARRDSRIRVVDGPGRGIVDALQAGLPYCRAPFVARMDADDWMHRERLATQLRALEESPQLAGLGCHVRSFPRVSRQGAPSRDATTSLRDGRRGYERWLRSVRDAEDVRRDAFVECPIAHPTWLLRRELLDTHPYRSHSNGRPVPEDYDLLLRLLGAGHELGVVPRRLLGWRDAPDRLSRTHEAYSDAAFTACKAEHLASGLLRAHRDYVLWGYGSTGRALRRALAEPGRHPSHIVELHPGRIRQRIHGAPVIEPGGLVGLHGRRIIASVAGAAPRAQIRESLHALGFVELQDFICAA